MKGSILKNLKRNLYIGFMCLLSIPAYTKNDIKTLTYFLDNIIANKQQYTSQKEQKINNLKNLLLDEEISLEYEYGINQKLYDEYRKYRLDSAIFYSERNVHIAELQDNNHLKYSSNIQLATIYSFSGRFRESEDILKRIDAQQLSPGILADYYEAYSRFFEHYGALSNQRKFVKYTEIYRDSLLSVLDSSSFRYKSNLAHKYLYDGETEKAESLLLTTLETVVTDTPEYALVTHYLGVVNGIKGKPELEKIYYTMSAIADIKNSLKENASFQRLALIYYDNGDIARAFRYAQSAIEDAVFSGVQFRTAQMSELYSIINASYQAKETKTNSKLKLYLLMISLLTFFMVLLVVYIYLQMKKLSIVKEELSQTNIKLTELNNELNQTNSLLNDRNEQLWESNHIKEQYIAQFFHLCSTYIDKIEDNRKGLLKIASNRQFEELMKKLKSTSLLETEIEELYKNFDSIFLDIYPTFVSEFNTLLMQEEQIILKSDDLLNTELRIYALLRLGISDSVQIASFLRCSMSTVYNYRTKMRNKAIVPRDEFENAVMNIGISHKKGN